jgi:GNAT superfamily N-acetyltransferase
MNISLATAEHYESLAHLLHELHLYSNPHSTVLLQTTHRHLTEKLVARKSPIELIVATDTIGNVTGFAAVVLLHSLVDHAPDVSGQCLLKELFVSKSHRNKGIGQALMAWIARFATANSCSRIDWNVKAGNTTGRAFYEKLGAQLVNDRLSYRLQRADVESLATKSKDL